MEYRFSLTPRLIALAIFSGVALMVLLFALGYQVGQGMAREARPVDVDAAGNPAGNSASTAAGNLADNAERHGASKLRAGVNAAVPPAVRTVQKAAQ